MINIRRKRSGYLLLQPGVHCLQVRLSGAYHRLGLQAKRLSTIAAVTLQQQLLREALGQVLISCSMLLKNMTLLSALTWHYVSIFSESSQQCR